MTTETLILAVLGAAGTLLMGLLSAGIIALVRVVLKNTHELAVLNSKIERIVENDHKVPKIQTYLNACFDMIKDLRKRLEG